MTKTTEIERKQFKPGNIISIKLRNFLTYNFIEFEFGPNLNFILGPNGSGKSSLICALFLGLCGKPEHLGRAPKLSAFVQNGKSDAIIELELKSQTDGQNFTIQRTFSASDDKTEWKLNNEKVSRSKVKDLITSLNIDVESLCNFLPQERVHSLSQLSANELFLETLKTTGGEVMIKQYHQLVEFKKDELSLVNLCAKEQQEIDILVKKNASIAFEVNRFQERESILNGIVVMKRKKSFLQYNLKREEFIESKKEYKKLKEDLKEMQKVLDPLEEERDELCKNLDKSSQAVLIANDKIYATDKLIKEVKSRIQVNGAGLREIRDKISHLEEARQKIAKEVKTKEKELERKEIELSKFTYDDSEREEINEEMKKLSAEARVVFAQKSSFEEDISACRRKLDDSEKEFGHYERTLEQLGDRNRKNRALLAKISPDSARALDWLDNNRNLFRKTIYRPLFMELVLKNDKYADMIENSISKQVFLSFVCESKEDYDLLTQKCIDDQSLKINVLCFEGRHSSMYTPKISKEELGFDGYISDYIEAPDPVLVSLFEQHNLFRTPISLVEISPEKCISAGIDFYFAGNQRYQIKKSRYGANLLSTRVSPTQKSVLLHDAAGFHEIQEIILKSKACKERGESAKIEYVNITERLKEITENYDRITKDLNELKDKQRKLNEARKYVYSMESQIKLIQERLKALEIEYNSLKVEGYIEDIRKLSEQRAKDALKLKDLIERRWADINHKISVSIDQVELNALEACMKIKIDQLKSEVDDFSVKVNDAKDLAESLKTQAQQLLEECGYEAPDFQEVSSKFEDYPSSVEELVVKITEDEAKADLALDVDQETIDTYTSRQAQIASLQEVLAQKEKERLNLVQKNQDLMSSWETKVLDIVQGISDSFCTYFKSLSDECQGAVQLNRDEEDMTKWGISIFVKYRNTEELAALDAHRQSGGERSVATMLYLMSLQSFSKTPFRVVDEINQGMDPRNERLVHRKIVETICCNEKLSGQYFLLTPKLLPDLVYHPKMKVLFVYNGIYMPEENCWESSDAEKWLKKRKRI